MTLQLNNLPSAPRGSLTLLPEWSEKKRYLEGLLLTKMASWGYREIVTPVFEYFDTMADAVSDDLLNRAYKLTDRQSGRVLILRADVTPQIARIAATALKDERPLRVSYSLNVFRYEEQYGGSQKEIHHIGAELIGVKTPEADAEIIAMLVELLELSGIKKYRVVLSHMDFLRGILSTVGHPEAERIFRFKDLSSLDRLLNEGTLSQTETGLIQKALFLYGDHQVLQQAQQMPLNDLSLKAVEELREVYRFLEIYEIQDRVSFDLSEYKGFQYHTGIVFEVVLEDMNRPIGFGGRYDRMMESFGCDAPATGFSLDLSTLINLADIDIERKRTVYIIDFSYDKTIAVYVARLLRQHGYVVCRDIIKRDLEESVRFAKRNGYTTVVKIMQGPVFEVLSIDPSTENYVEQIKDILKEAF